MKESKFMEQRGAGVLAHITSLPSQYGIGDLGPAAREFADWLSAARMSYWQILPLGPTGYGNSPYSSFSAFAGNTLLISPDNLLEEGLLSRASIADLPKFPAGKVDFGSVIPTKRALLQKAYTTFTRDADAHQRASYEYFCETNSYWLDDFALFAALKDSFGGKAWRDWDAEYRQKSEEALLSFANKNSKEIEFHKVCQFIFNKQWLSLRRYINNVGISFIGDIPIFVAADSCDVWANKEQFQLREDGSPMVVAGVPPDYFSETGQLWGNPHYNWEGMKHDGFSWWIRRLERLFSLCDVVRIDHFRGFEAYWEVPGDAPTAIDGRWVKAPGEELFSAIRQYFGAAPIIAEDLGVITPEVTALRKKFSLPGMKIMQFGYESLDPSDPFLPHNFEQDCVVYTGTHDNDTTLGWYHAAPPKARLFAETLLNTDSATNIVRQMIREAYLSTAVAAIIPVQDFLLLDSSARINMPGRADGNWEFRFTSDKLHSEIAQAMSVLAVLSNRVPLAASKLIPYLSE